MRRFLTLWLLMVVWILGLTAHSVTVLTAAEIEENSAIIEPEPEPDPGFAPPPPDPDQPWEDPYKYLPPPPPEDIVYDPSEPTVTIPYTITDPDTGETTDVEVYNNEIFVCFAPEATEEDIEAILVSIGGWRKVYKTWLDTWVIGIPPATSQTELDSKLQTISNHPLVEVAVPSIAVSTLSIEELHPNDPYYHKYQLGSYRERHFARI